MRQYSRLASVEEKRNLKKAYLFLVLTIVAGITLFFIGIPFLGRFTAFVSDLGKSDKTITGGDTTPPAPPRFSTFPEYTNKDRVEINGNVEAGVTVKIAFNGREEESLSDKNGDFSFDFALNDDENVFSGIAIDSAGNTSQRTKDFKIIFDDESPELSIDKPSDGSQFFGSKQRQVSIEGVTDSGTQITINDRVVLVEEDGKFQFSITLNEGGNTFNVKATDQAGNITEKSFTVNFSS